MWHTNNMRKWERRVRKRDRDWDGWTDSLEGITLFTYVTLLWLETITSIFFLIHHKFQGLLFSKIKSGMEIFTTLVTKHFSWDPEKKITNWQRSLLLFFPPRNLWNGCMMSDKTMVSIQNSQMNAFKCISINTGVYDACTHTHRVV